MTSFTKRLMIAAATMVVATGVVSAETLKAEIPFSFFAGGKMMAPGSYSVITLNRNLGMPSFKLYDADRRTAALAVPNYGRDPKALVEKAHTPILTFDCAGGHCELSSIWTGRGQAAYKFMHRKLKNETTAMRTEVIAMRVEKGE